MLFIHDTISSFDIHKRGNKMSNKITMMSEEFQNEQTGQSVEGITIIVDGVLKQFIEIIQAKSPDYQNSLSVVQDALMKGLNTIKNEIDK